MKSQVADLSVLRDIHQGTSRAAKWGNMTVGTLEVRQTLDLEPLLK
jgi:hypothetical protein